MRPIASSQFNLVVDTPKNLFTDFVDTRGRARFDWGL